MNQHDILVVDDERPIADFLSEVLHDEGYNVRIAYNAAQALELLGKRVPGLLLLDVRMPGMDGVTLLTLLQQRGLGAAPVVVMSADARVGQEIPPGAVGFLEKPFTIETLLESVSRHYSQTPVS